MRYTGYLYVHTHVDDHIDSELAVVTVTERCRDIANLQIVVFPNICQSDIRLGRLSLPWPSSVNYHYTYSYFLTSLALRPWLCISPDGQEGKGDDESWIFTADTAIEAAGTTTTTTTTHNLLNLPARNILILSHSSPMFPEQVGSLSPVESGLK